MTDFVTLLRHSSPSRSITVFENIAIDPSAAG
jgi:hypothetical protein